MGGDWWILGRWTIAAILASYMSVSGFRKKSLDKSGAIAEGGQRNAVQVLSCSLFATILAVIHLFLVGVGDSLVDFRAQPWGATLLCAYLGFYACCAGDTWSSELGVLSSRPPRLVTSPWRDVPRGTNGGISPEGTAASAVAGGFMGAGFVFFGWMVRLAPPPTSSNASQMPLILLGMASGVVGSVIDSFMGAVLQASYFDRNRKVIVEKPSSAELTGGHLELLCGRDILSNEQINVLSAVLTSVLAGVLGRFLSVSSGRF